MVTKPGRNSAQTQGDDWTDHDEEKHAELRPEEGKKRELYIKEKLKLGSSRQCSATATFLPCARLSGRRNANAGQGKR